DLSFPIELIKVPTIREPDGLAMSSRNLRLTSAHRAKAKFIYDALLVAEKMLRQGASIGETNLRIKELFLEDNDFQLEYFEVVDSESLEKLDQKPNNGKAVLCIAAYLGGIRLIDNMFFIS